MVGCKLKWNSNQIHRKKQQKQKIKEYTTNKQRKRHTQFHTVRSFDKTNLYTNLPVNETIITSKTIMIIIIIIISWDYSSLWASPCQMTAGLTFTCLKLKVNDHPTSLGGTSDQQVRSPSHLERDYCYKINRNCPWCWVGIDPIHWPKIPFTIK